MASDFPGGQNALAYQGVEAIAPPTVIRAQRAPTTTDRRHKIGTMWIDQANDDVYQFTNVSNGSAVWTVLGSTSTIPLPVADGGTGATTLTDHGVLVGSGTSAITALSVGTNGQLLVGSTGADPVFATIASSDGSVTRTTGAGTLGLTVTQATTSQLGGATFATDSEVRIGTASNEFVAPSSIAALKNYTDITLRQSPILQSNANTGAAPSGATGDVNLMCLESGEIMQSFILGAGQTIIAPRMTTTGLLTSLDLTNAEGAEYNFGVNPNSKHAYTIGTSAAFFIELQVNAADVGGLDPFMVGFRKQQANDATLANYTDFATIGARATTAADVIILQTQLNGGGVVITNTTDAWTDGQTKTFRVNVSGAGVVTYLINGVAPTTTAAFTFDTGDVVSPFIRHLFGATTPAAINWIQLRIGLQ